MDITEPGLELVRRCACELPPDVQKALAEARDREEGGSMAHSVFASILENVELAGRDSLPMCQDTGAPTFWIYYPRAYSQKEMEEQLTEAVIKASGVPYLRPNAVDPVTGKNSGDNTGNGAPVFHCHEWDEDHLKVDLMLKGGGSENVSAQYKLPEPSLGAGRNLEGVRKCVIDAVFQAQGKGCAPGIIGLGIGGNRDTGITFAKQALMRKLDEPNPDPALDELEKGLLEDLNSLGIGGMGFGGKTTVLSVKAVSLHRLPACFFVSVAYMCWAMRRHTMIIKGGEVSYD
ncbi:MAG: fumarate hydratase [Planctomycetota bacterium]|nr:fumarate hydratase [Planctomycetota bacterium]